MKIFSGIPRLRRLPDLSYSYTDPTIATKQRERVDQQLAAMTTGNAPDHFKVVGTVLTQLRNETDLASIKLLDAGCGSAYYFEIAEFFAPGWVEYAGVDFNPGMLAMARRYYPDLPLARMDLRNLALRDASFDLVMSGAAIVHIREWREAVQELARTTRRWLLLHRTLVWRTKPTSVKVERHYAKDVYRVRINEGELLDLMNNLEMNLVMKCDAGEGTLPPGQENNTYLFEKRRV